jgi:tRNA dimethylallyltransferase
VKRVAIVGSTASGKSAVALEIARHVAGTELLSIDAMQVYRRMNIGTAKPSAAEQAEVAHHLIDLVEPSVEFSVADFQRAATDVQEDLKVRRVPLSIAVGGTGLYLTALVDGLDLPGQWPERRARLEVEAEADVLALHRRLTALDPVAAERMEPTNARRIVRALEVCEGSGRPFSSFGPGVASFPQTDVALVGLRWDRDALRQRIAQRVAAMIDAGLLDEVRGLAAEPVSRTARQALGYKELFDHLDRIWSLPDAIAAIVLRTQQFAVRQERWFRRDPRIRWIDVTIDPISEAVPEVLELLAR